MKLSTKIVLGFILTNIVYLLLLSAIFIFVRPLSHTAELLSQYVMPFNDLIADMKFNVSEQRSNTRAFEASAHLDQDIFDKAVQHCQNVTKDLEALNKIFGDPKAAYLNTPALNEAYKKAAEAFNGVPEMLQETREFMVKEQEFRKSVSAVATKVLDELGETIKAENEAFADEISNNFSEDVLSRRYGRLLSVASLRAAVYDSWEDYSLGIIRDDPEFFKESMAKSSEAVEMMGTISDETKTTYPKIKEHIEKAKDLLDNSYAPGLTAFIKQKEESTAHAAKRSAKVQSLIERAGEFNLAINDRFDEFTADLSAVVRKVVTSMLTGIILALVASSILAVFITRSIVRPINIIIDNLNLSANEVDSASSQLTSAANTLASGATENAASLEETSASLEELSSMTRRNADNASEAKALMGQAAEVVSQAEGSMTKVIAAMAEISRSGNEIGKIIKTIDEIAFQTNLLALNAAVEAARAGEAGAGFAVVADEVRNLAIRSADAAKTTADLIESTIGNINSGSELVNETSEAFKAVSLQASKVHELVAEVAEASGEQRQGIDQITKAMSEMDKVTQSNAASAEESASAASELSHQAGSLLTVVSEMQTLAYGAEHNRGRASGGKPPRPGLSGPAAPGPKAISGYPAAPGPNQAADSSKAMPMDDSFDF